MGIDGLRCNFGVAEKWSDYLSETNVSVEGLLSIAIFKGFQEARTLVCQGEDYRVSLV